MKRTLALGIDIGGTNTCFGIVDEHGNIITKNCIPTTGHSTVEAYVADLATAVQPLIAQVGRDQITGAGIGAPNGNFFTGEIVFAPNLPWHGTIPMATLIGDALGMPAKLTNDANAAAIGEMTYGVARGLKDFILVTLGTGVGSGFVANGQLIYGHDGFAGEMGHITAVRNGRLCGCGRYGCLETYASATGIVRSAEEWLSTRNEPTILRRDAGNLSARQIFEAAQAGDKMAVELFDFTGRILGQTLADMVAITSPSAIIFFGGLARAGNMLLGPTHKYMEENMLNIFRNKVKLIVSALPDADAAILGASALAW